MKNKERKYLKPTNPKDRVAIQRLDLSLILGPSMVEEAHAMTEGDLKYGAFNYREEGVLASVYIAAILRHLMKWYNGEETDVKTQVGHLGSAKAGLGVLIDSIYAGNMKDDRPPVSPKLSERIDAKQEAVAHLQGLFKDGPGRFTEKGRTHGRRK